MLDVHVIISHDTDRAWVSQCLESITCAIGEAQFPVAVHVVDGIPGHIGQARAMGYSLGTQPYVTCVDDDDYVLPHAFAQMKDSLGSGASAVFTPELTLQNEKLRNGAKRHHLAAYRRNVLIDHTQWPCCGDIAQMRAVGEDALDLPEPGYIHRLYMQSKARIMRRNRLDELERARG